MDYRRLGRTDIEVSVICLGTMTFGQQNSEAEAHRQLDYAVDHGVNFLDTAEMYPVPPRPETVHRTEEYLGTWLAKPENRARMVVATKVSGRTMAQPSGPPFLHWVRDGPRLNRAHIEAAIDASLARLRIDCVDLYQLHWPERAVNSFGTLGYTHEPREEEVPIEETLQVLGDLVDAGKVRHVGLSNETPWGSMQFLACAERHGLPRAAAIQNPYSLLDRSFEVGLSEVAHQEDIGLLAYSPLGNGVLSGKYLNGARPADGRLTLFERFQRYTGDQGTAATKAYVDLARDSDLDPARMALAYVNSRPFITSNIIGATTMEQLESNIASAEITLSDDVLACIEEIHAIYTYPCP
jgi:aryl-alcohol dehydrogenase-like predicted oxidoreductase